MKRILNNNNIGRDFLIIGSLVLSAMAPATISAFQLSNVEINEIDGYSRTQPWRSIQEKAKDTVVQVFAYFAEVDLLQPYLSPKQGSGSGSGFFINEDGYLVTNAHVVNQAAALWIRIPSLGKFSIDVEVVGICFDKDIALLKVTDEGLKLIKEMLGKVPYLPLGDSDKTYRADEVLALGYPLGQESLKSTTGVLSGRQEEMLQMSAPINPGNSGGPLLNIYGQVIGINSAGILSAQSVGYAIPINDLKVILPDLYTNKVLRKPFLTAVLTNATDSLTAYLGNPQPGGAYVCKVTEDSPLQHAGLQAGDMIYEIDGHRIDIFKEMTTPWSEDKVSVYDYFSRIAIGDKIDLVVYRKGERKEISFTYTQPKLPTIHSIYPGYEPIEYEVIAGMVVTPLTTNHIHLLVHNALGLIKYTEVSHRSKKTLVVTHVLPNSQLDRSSTISAGMTINTVNGKEVQTLDDLRSAIRGSSDSDYLSIEATDHATRMSDHLLVVLPFKKVLEEDELLASIYQCPLSEVVRELIEK